MLEHDHAQEEESEDYSQREVFLCDDSLDETGQLVIERCVERIFVLSVAFVGFDDAVAIDGGLHEGEHPAHGEGDGQHHEQRLDDLGRIAGGQVKGQEREDGDDRGPQQAPLRLGGSLLEGLHARHALRDLHLRVAGHHDGVVHQHAHGDDNGGQ